ncbi:hypothetical protein [Metabacillus sp. RGM 3146]
MNKDGLFPVAQLDENHLNNLKKAEQLLREETGEEIVIIAYQHKNNQN